MTVIRKSYNMCSKCVYPRELRITRCCVFLSAYQASQTLHTEYNPLMKPITHKDYSFHCKPLNSICYHLTLKKPHTQKKTNKKLFWFQLPLATKAPCGCPSPHQGVEENEKKEAETGGSG